ncbi:MAG: glucose-6-phosphate dehydrogenase [bacterium]|nr:glucose-6-phosphate dehydrogenase [bacterium]
MRINKAVTFVIFGATGDVARKKLFSALYSLFVNSLLPEQFNIVGFSRSEHANESFQAIVTSILLKSKSDCDVNSIKKFVGHISYVAGDFADGSSYEELYRAVSTIDKINGECASRLIYLAVPPCYYDDILKQLSISRISSVCNPDGQWTRILIEKPFGSNARVAEQLENTVASLFKDEQIYRIDYYLAKETIENILAFRFSNTLFEPAWSNAYIDRVHISMHEQFGVEKRGTFYDGVGALRDVGQNHILQMLALVTMENPGSIKAESVRARREDILRALDIGTNGAHALRGQYKGYRQEIGVDESSDTETYFCATAFVNSDRWKGVPFILEAGKKLRDTRTDITFYFKRQSDYICADDIKRSLPENVVTFRIQPNEAISIRFSAKVPGLTYALEARELTYMCDSSPFSERLPDTYERILYDCIRGDQTRFPSSKEVAYQWKFISSLKNLMRVKPLITYTPGVEHPCDAHSSGHF